MTVIDPYEAPDNIDPETVAAVEEAAPEYTDLNLQRRFRIIFAIGIAGLALMGWLLIRAATSSGELDDLRSRIGQLTDTIGSQQLLIDKLATQVDEARAQGAAVPAPEVIAAQVPDAAVSPVAPATGERGEAGVPGVAGEPGIGTPGSQGEKGDVGADSQVPGPQGAQGAPGIGVAGANGADGQSIVGPAGVDGQNGTDGVDGVDGQPGADGAPGSPGAQGPAGPPPSSFTFTIGLATYECTPTSPGATTYTCAVVP